ncbi:MAG: hypothetical protein WCD49_05150 [Candidatus Acidiferrales bacterium]
MPSAARPKTFAAGAGLVWRWQRILWWIFVVNLVLAHFAVRGLVDRVSPALVHSFASQRLVNGFDLTAILELAVQPDSPFEAPGPVVFHYSVIFAIFMIFSTGGIIATYVFDSKPTTTAFFEACGHHFWRFVRLLVYMLLAFIPIGILIAVCSAIHTSIDEKSNSPYPAVYFFFASTFVVLLLLMVLRLWFDMAQVIAVADDETRMHHSLRRAASLLRHNFGSLFWLYLRISLLAWIFCGLGLYLWMYVLNPLSITTAFLLTQLMLIFWIASRLWQRASEALWYRQYQATIVTEPAYSPPPAPAPVPYSTAMN